MVAVGPDFDRDIAVVRGKFECVGKEVEEDLGVSRFISVNVLEEKLNVGIDFKNGVDLFTNSHIFDITDSILNSLS